MVKLKKSNTTANRVNTTAYRVNTTADRIISWPNPMAKESD